MAKFLSHIATAISGSAGNTTYAKGRNGLHFGVKAVPTQPRTTAQTDVRAAFTGSAQSWRGLTDAQRAGWDNLGKQMTITDSLGQSSTLTGSQAHVSLNGVLSTAGTPAIADAPSQKDAIVPLPTITLDAARQGTAQGAFSLFVRSAAYAGKVQVYASPAVSAGRNKFGSSSFRLLGVVSGLTDGGTAITGAYLTKYGAPTPGSKIAIKLVPISPSGFRGAKYHATAIVAVES